VSQIAGRNILITGGASGIGRLMALEMARLGGNVVIWDVNTAGLDAVVSELKATSSNIVRGYHCDVSNRQDVYETASRVRSDVGTIHILVNNAGVVSGKSLTELTDTDIERTLGVNTMALFWTLKAFLPSMLDINEGHVVTIASAAGTIGVAGLADYCASKWAAVGLDEALRVELKCGNSRIKTTVVCPYFINTGMFHGVKTRFPLLLPILDAAYVSKWAVKAIQKNRRRLMMPRFVYLVPLLKLLPANLADALASWLGVNVAMDSFQGRSADHQLTEK
jgi:all-trans-retinol dehydrogenase (NAD+)